jgi:hypothetical protein
MATSDDGTLHNFMRDLGASIDYPIASNARVCWNFDCLRAGFLIEPLSEDRSCPECGGVTESAQAQLSHALERS